MTKTERKAARAREAEELRNRRARQLETSRSAIGMLGKELQTLRVNAARHQALSSHLDGFYEEIDKLAKGKSLFEATNLVVEHANEIIKDAKEIIQGDAYLDRVKQFVPAGTNPVYPDVLVIMRTVQQSVDRSDAHLKDRSKKLTNLLSEARTIACAIECYLETDGVPLMETVREGLDGAPEASQWFRGEYGAKYFDFDRLDRRDLQAYLSESGELDDLESNESEQDHAL